MFSDSAQLTLDLRALVANFHQLMARSKASSQVVAVIKSDCYGLGRDRIIPTLYDAGCRFFMTDGEEDALNVEALLSRHAACCDYRIMGFGVFEGFEHFLNAESPIVPVICNQRQLEISLQCKRERPEVIWHFNTGMNRFGMSMSQAEIVAKRWKEIRQVLKVLFISSHFGSANEPYAARNVQQIDRMQRLRELFIQARFSFSNSSAVFMLEQRGDSDLCDHPRVGGGLWGITPLVTQSTNPLNPVVKALEIPIRMIDKNSNAAILSIAASELPGGYELCVGNASSERRANVFVNGQATTCFLFRRGDPTSSVCIETAGIAIEERSLVEIIGPNQSFEEYARAIGVPPYPLITQLQKIEADARCFIE